MAKRRLGSISTADLSRELQRRQNSLSSLHARRNRLARELGMIDGEIQSLGDISAVMASRGPGRPRKIGRPPGRRPVGRPPKRKPGRPRVAAAGRPSPVRRRPRNKLTLVQALQKTLKNKTMSVTEISGAVQRGGYKTTSKTFRTIVNQTLIKNPRVFKKIARGQYTAT